MKWIFQVDKANGTSPAERMSLGIFLSILIGVPMAIIYMMISQKYTFTDILLSFLFIMMGVIGWIIADRFIAIRSNESRATFWLYAKLSPEELQNDTKKPHDETREVGIRIMNLMIQYHDDPNSLSRKIGVQSDAIIMLSGGTLKREYAIEVAHRIAAHYKVPFYDLVKDIL